MGLKNIKLPYFILGDWKPRMCDRLKAKREELQLSQQDIAFELMVERSAISRIESGQTALTVDMLISFSHLYDMPVDEILFGKQNKEKDAEFFTNMFLRLSKRDKEEIVEIMKMKESLSAKYHEHTS